MSPEPDWAAWGLREREPGVLVSGRGVATADGDLVEALRRYAGSLPRRRARILFHGDEADPLHEMLITAAAFTLWPPLLNDRAPQSWTVVAGELAFLRYREPGEVVELVRLGVPGSGLPSYLRFSEPDWYTTVPLTDMAVYMEVKRGPHRATRSAPWGPQSADDPAGRALIDRLKAVSAIAAR